MLTLGQNKSLNWKYKLLVSLLIVTLPGIGYVSYMHYIGSDPVSNITNLVDCTDRMFTNLGTDVASMRNPGGLLGGETNQDMRVCSQVFNISPKS